MKKTTRIIVLMTTIALLFSLVGGFTYALPDSSVSAPRAVSRITVAIDRTSTEKATANISGSTTSVASSITMTATLYEYNSGKLTKVNGASITKKTTNSAKYDFNASFNLTSGKSYKVTAVIVDVTNGASTTTSKTSSVF